MPKRVALVDDELLVILSFLTFADILKVSATNNRKMLELSKSSYWREMYLDYISVMEELHLNDQDYSEATNLPLALNYRNLFFEQMRKHYINSAVNEKEFIKRIEELKKPLKNTFKTCTELLQDYPDKEIERHVKFLVVGDRCGKTSFMYHLSLGLNPPYSNLASNLEYVPSIHDGYSTNIQFGSTFCSIGFWDSSGNLQHDRLRSLSYPDTDVCFLCFDCMSYDSANLAIDKFLKGLESFMAEAVAFPIALLATKQDLKLDRKQVLKLLITKQQKPISSQIGERMAKALGCVTYLESIVLASEEYFKIIFNISKIDSLPTTTCRKTYLSSKTE